MKSAIVRGDYERARRKSFVRAIASWLRRSDNALLAFEDMRRGIHAQAQRDGGLQEVQIDHIVGSVGRYRDFDRAFLPRQARTRDRWESVDRAHRERTEVPRSSFTRSAGSISSRTGTIACPWLASAGRRSSTHT